MLILQHKTLKQQLDVRCEKNIRTEYEINLRKRNVDIYRLINLKMVRMHIIKILGIKHVERIDPKMVDSYDQEKYFFFNKCYDLMENFCILTFP